MYNWIEQTLGVGDGLARILAFTVSLIVVLVLFALFVIILKRLMGTNFTGPRNRQPRIQIMDAASIDPKRRLVLVRRDNVEHLLLVGGTTDVVVEQSIIRNAPLGAQHPRQVPTLATGPGPLPEPPADLDFDDEEVPTPRKAAPKPVEMAAKKAEPVQAPVVEAASAEPFEAPSRAASEETKRTSPNPEASLIRAAAGGLFASRHAKADEKKQEAQPLESVETAPAPLPRSTPEAATIKATVPVQQPASTRIDAPNQSASLSGLSATRSAHEPRPSSETVATVWQAPAVASPAAVPSDTADDTELFEPPQQEPHKTAPLATTLANFAARKPVLGQSPVNRTPPKITPPASGPAARAKTAVLSGSGGVLDGKEDTGAEDTASEAGVETPAEPVTSKSEPLPFPWRGSTPAPQVVKPTEIAASAKTDAEETDPADTSSTAAETPPSVTGKPEASLATAGIDAPQQAVSEDDRAQVSADDLDQPLGTGPKTAAGNKITTVSSSPSAARDQENDNTRTEDPAVVKTPASPFKPVVVPSAPTVQAAPPVQPAPKVELSPVRATPTEVNPIEAEMEKLLDEIHGPRSI